MKLFGLIGYPLTHSFSKKYFTEKFENEGIKDCKYELFEIKTIEELPSIIKTNPNLKGLNVTIPYKEAVIGYLDEVDPAAEQIKAVNVIKVENGKLKGFNSDFFGFRQSLINFVASPYMANAFEPTSTNVFEGSKINEVKSIGTSASINIEMAALILGTGGAAKAVKAALESLGIPHKTVSRTEGQADFVYHDLNDKIQHYNLIINTSPLGMYPKTDTCPEIPYDKLSKNHYLFDLVYNPEETLFMKKGREKGARTKNGLEMLYLQAEKAWSIWNQ
jgi:shikimate dehydrogenase